MGVMSRSPTCMHYKSLCEVVMISDKTGKHTHTYTQTAIILVQPAKIMIP